MAGSKVPGAVCQVENPVEIDEGTLCLAASPPPASVGSDNSTLTAVHNFFASEYSLVTTSLETAYEGVAGEIEANYKGACCIFQAYLQAQELAPAAILEETGRELGALVKGLLPGLIQMIVIVAATTTLGAVVGGIIGALAGGVGTAPGAVVGGELGLDAGVAILTWLGVAFLAVTIAKGMGEMLSALGHGVELAWQARNLDGPAEENQITQGARELARSVGILFRLILQAIVVYLLKKAAMNATRGVMSTAGAVRAEGAAAVSDAVIADLVKNLRASKFSGDFADWVEKNWRDLVKDPRLKESGPTALPESADSAGGGGTGTQAQKVESPKSTAKDEAGEGRTPPKETPLKISEKKLQAKYKHAKDFGVDGNYSKANAAKYSEALTKHVNDPGTQTIQGTYRGSQVVHKFNPVTGNDVILDTDGNFVSGWKLNPDQARCVTTTGNLGGG